MTPAKRTWRAHLTRAWRTDPFTRSLDLESRMVYFELLDIAWDEGGLHAHWLTEGIYVAQQIGITRRKFKAIWPSIREKFAEISPGVWSNSKLESERIRADKHVENQANRAKKRWEDDAVAMQAGINPAMLTTTITTTTSTTTDTNTLAQAPPDASFNQDQAFADCWKGYPRKLGSKAAKRSFKATVKNTDDLARIQKALFNFISHHEQRRTEADFIPHGSTWFNNWADWVDHVPTQTRIHFAQPKAPSEPMQTIAVSGRQKL